MKRFLNGRLTCPAFFFDAFAFYIPSLTIKKYFPFLEYQHTFSLISDSSRLDSVLQKKSFFFNGLVSSYILIIPSSSSLLFLCRGKWLFFQCKPVMDVWVVDGLAYHLSFYTRAQGVQEKLCFFVSLTFSEFCTPFGQHYKCTTRGTTEGGEALRARSSSCISYFEHVSK